MPAARCIARDNCRRREICLESNPVTYLATGCARKAGSGFRLLDMATTAWLLAAGRVQRGYPLRTSHITSQGLERGHGRTDGSSAWIPGVDLALRSREVGRVA